MGLSSPNFQDAMQEVVSFPAMAELLASSHVKIERGAYLDIPPQIDKPTQGVATPKLVFCIFTFLRLCLIFRALIQGFFRRDKDLAVTPFQETSFLVVGWKCLFL